MAPDDRAFVALVGYQDQGNLGLGYLAAKLRERGHTVEMIDVRDGAEQISGRLLSHSPTIVGFSLIFQCFLPEFRSLARRLRRDGVASHFTIGGHFPSLCPEELLAQFPELDSIVLYEGEETLADLAGRLCMGEDWRQTPGIAYLRSDRLQRSDPRALVQDLDTLPFPLRPYEPETIGAFRTLPLLASRGCVRRCSFCSIHKFYGNALGRSVRIRKPGKVIEEMLQLQRQHAARIFLFQDDDFPLWGARGRRWSDEFVQRLRDSGLAERTLWKISCRSEYVDVALFSRLRDAGLFLVYLGLESGDEQGLETLNKETTVAQNLIAVSRLRELGILGNYGFMLFDPSSSFESIRRNVNFLRQVVGDGHTAAAFGRMLPYCGTPIYERLNQEGRLRGDITNPDYDFLDRRLNDYYRRLSRTVGSWLDKQGLSYLLNYAWYEFEAVTRLVSGMQGAEGYRASLRALTAQSNAQLLDLVETSSFAAEQGNRATFDIEAARAYCVQGRTRLLDMRNRFIANNLERLQCQ